MNNNIFEIETVEFETVINSNTSNNEPFNPIIGIILLVGFIMLLYLINPDKFKTYLKIIIAAIFILFIILLFTFFAIFP